jgi:TRAP-type C4-dicarboxylate transport system permease small subunit
MAGAQREGAEATLGQLFASASQDLSTLVRSEVALAKAEIQHEVQRAATGAAMFAAAGFFMLLAVVLLSIAAAHGLHALGVPLGWAYMIVTGAYLLIAAILVLVGRRVMRRIGPPTRTIRTTKDNVALLKGSQATRGL